MCPFSLSTAYTDGLTCNSKTHDRKPQVHDLLLQGAKIPITWTFSFLNLPVEPSLTSTQINPSLELNRSLWIGLLD